jgi:phenylalanine-4-hydroxylase
LHKIYQQIRDIRNQKNENFKAQDLYLKLKNNHPEDWLGALELLEVLEQRGIEINLKEEITNYLKSKIDSRPELKKLITDGIKLIAQPVNQLITQ